MGRIWIGRRIISSKGIVCLGDLISCIATHVCEERWEKGIAGVPALLSRGIRKDHRLGIVRIERPSASTGLCKSTGFRPSASTGLVTSTRPSASTG